MSEGNDESRCSTHSLQLCSISVVLNWIFWSCYVLSTPIILIIMVAQGIPIGDMEDEDSIRYGFINMFVFSAGLNGLYFYPWLLFHEPLTYRLERATMNWVGLSVFEEVLFQFPHNIFESVIWELQGKGTVVEWPYWVYALSDSRWNDYRNGKGLDWFVWTCNLWEGGMGLLICLVVLLQKYHWSKKYGSQAALSSNEFACDFGCNTKHDEKPRRTYLFILIVLFRDAMLLRQTFSYCTDQHDWDYPFSMAQYEESHPFRKQGIAGLYTINTIWIIAPVTTLIWAYVNFRKGLNQYTLMLQEKDRKLGVPGKIDLVEVVTDV